MNGNGRKLFISIMYHYIRDLKHSRYPEIKGLDIELFRKQIDYFKANFHVVTMEQVIEAVDSKKPLPEKSVLLPLMMDMLITIRMCYRFWKKMVFKVLFLFQGRHFHHISYWMLIRYITFWQVQMSGSLQKMSLSE